MKRSANVPPRAFRIQIRTGSIQCHTNQPAESGPWDSALAQLQKWDPEWAETCPKMRCCGLLSSRWIAAHGDLSFEFQFIFRRDNSLHTRNGLLGDDHHLSEAVRQ